MLRLQPRAIRQLFQPTLDGIKQAITDVLNESVVNGRSINTLNHRLLIIELGFLTTADYRKLIQVNHATYQHVPMNFILEWESQ